MKSIRRKKHEDSKSTKRSPVKRLPMLEELSDSVNEVFSEVDLGKFGKMMIGDTEVKLTRHMVFDDDDGGDDLYVSIYYSVDSKDAEKIYGSAVSANVDIWEYDLELSEDYMKKFDYNVDKVTFKDVEELYKSETGKYLPGEKDLKITEEDLKWHIKDQDLY